MEIVLDRTQYHEEREKRSNAQQLLDKIKREREGWEYELTPIPNGYKLKHIVTEPKPKKKRR